MDASSIHLLVVLFFFLPMLLLLGQRYVTPEAFRYFSVFLFASSFWRRGRPERNSFFIFLSLHENFD